MKRRNFYVAALVLCLVFLFAFPAVASSRDDKAMLTAIDALARQGWILNCSARVKTDTFDNVEEELGRADTSNYVASAKGTYLQYDAPNIVVGYGKGDLIFELRSYDSRLHSITLGDVEEHFGEPDHVTESNGEKYVSYILNEDFNIKFVFRDNGDNPSLKHYNVIWLDGTANSMADDSGRKW